MYMSIHHKTYMYVRAVISLRVNVRLSFKDTFICIYTYTRERIRTYVFMYVRMYT